MVGPPWLYDRFRNAGFRLTLPRVRQRVRGRALKKTQIQDKQSSNSFLWIM